MGLDRPTLRKSIRDLPGAAWLLFAGTFINKFGSFVIVFLAVYVTREGYSAAQAGLAVSAYGVGALISQPLGGYLADRLGRRSTIALSMFSAAAALLGLAWARGLAVMIPLTGIVGFASELWRPASNALLADLTPPGQRVPAFAMKRLAVNLGFAAGPAVGGFLAERSFLLLFVGDALTSAVFGIVALVALPEGRRRTAASGEAAGWTAMLRDRGFMAFLVATTTGVMVMTQAFSTFALHVSELLSGAAYGALISLNGILIVSIELPIASVTQRLRPRPVMALGLLLMGLGFSMTGAGNTAAWLALVVIIWTLGEIVYMPVAAAYVADNAPEGMGGLYQGAWGSTHGLAFVLGPALGAAVYAMSPGLLWLACLSLGLLSAALILTAPAPREAVADETLAG